MSDGRLIVVLGMHRSGTSAITKGLEVMGINLGGNLMAGDANNEKGYFEDADINRLNIELLEVLGHDWATMGPVDEGKLQALRKTDFAERARSLLLARLSKAGSHGLKDPRICRLLPFWTGVFSDLEIDVSYILMLRDPDSIAASLFSRNGIPRIKSLYMWAMHIIPAFLETTGSTRAVVDYDDLITSPREMIGELSESLGLSNAIDDNALTAFATDFVDPKLRHHQGIVGGDKQPTPRLIARLASLIDEAQAKKLDIDSNHFSRKLRQLGDDLRDRFSLMEYVDTLDRIILQNHHKIQAAERQATELFTFREEASEALSSLEKSWTTSESRITELKASLEAHQRRIEFLAQTVGNHVDAMKELSAAIAQNQERLETMQQEVCISQSALHAKEHFIEMLISDMDGLLVELEAIKSSHFWKYSRLSRRFWNLTEALSRKERCQLIPTNHVERARPGIYGWLATGPDPNFRLVPNSGKTPKGWVQIKSRIEDAHADGIVRLYLDCGQGFSEADVVNIPILPHGEISQIVFLPKNLVSLRWDPRQKEGLFRQYPIVIAKKTWTSGKLLMIGRVTKVLWVAGEQAKSDANLSWSSLFVDLGQAYEKASRLMLDQG
jgi:hypothetical protein